MKDVGEGVEWSIRMRRRFGRKGKPVTANVYTLSYQDQRRAGESETLTCCTFQTASSISKKRQ